MQTLKLNMIIIIVVRNYSQISKKNIKCRAGTEPPKSTSRVVLITAVSDILQILQEDQKTSPFR